MRVSSIDFCIRKTLPSVEDLISKAWCTRWNTCWEIFIGCCYGLDMLN